MENKREKILERMGLLYIILATLSAIFSVAWACRDSLWPWIVFPVSQLIALVFCAASTIAPKRWAIYLLATANAIHIGVLIYVIGFGSPLMAGG